MAEGASAKSSHALDLVLTVIMALAAVGTAWAGFQSAKWGGVQANSYAEAGATRTESSRMTTRASQQRTIDVISFTSWLNALNQEIIAGTTPRPQGAYAPAPDSVSGLLFQRFRSEFRPAVDAWLAEHPLINPDAAATPFEMPEYQLQTEADAVALEERAERLSAQARVANQRSDNYVLMAVVFALVLFFAGLAGRAQRALPRNLFLAMALIALLGAMITLILLPVEV